MMEQQIINVLGDLSGGVARLKEENERFRAALEFYADLSHYDDATGCDDPSCCSPTLSSIDEDCGDVARAALGLPAPPEPPIFSSPAIQRHRVPCMTGGHHWHWSIAAQEKCQRTQIDADFLDRFKRFQEACDAMAGRVHA